MKAVDMNTFLRDRGTYLAGKDAAAAAVEFGTPRVHYESQDTWSGTLTHSLDWRAEVRLTAVDAPAHAPDVVAGFVDFLVLQLGNEPVNEALKLYGERAEAFAELFDGAWLASGLDESDEFAGGMPIGAVLLVLDAQIDRTLGGCLLRPWAVSRVISTMLPTTAGVVAMKAGSGPATSRRARHLINAAHLDDDWARVGCAPIPGRPHFVGQATAYTYLDDAHRELDAVRQQTFLAEVSEAQ